MRYLLDTNVLSEVTRPVPDAGVMVALARHREDVATSAVVVHELRYGVARMPAGRRRSVLEAFVAAVARSSMPVLAYDGTAAAWHAMQRAALEADGRTPSFVDGMIAATAVVHDLVVVTRNATDFHPFGVPIKSWWQT